VIDLIPEALFVNAEYLEERRLHVSGNEGFVKIPDTGDDVLTMNGSLSHVEMD